MLGFVKPDLRFYYSLVIFGIIITLDGLQFQFCHNSKFYLWYFLFQIDNFDIVFVDTAGLSACIFSHIVSVHMNSQHIMSML